MHTNLIFSEGLVVAVDKLARQMGVSRSDVFRKALERYLEQQSEINDEAMSSVHGKTGDPVAVSAVDDDEEW
jgi:metal-responsive CopG/Arc/MetJ family transcriptional regulator